MKCPECGSGENRVIDSRVKTDGSEIRRRRECEACGYRYTTYERYEEIFPYVVKRDGTREVFDKRKILLGIEKACEKRPVSAETIDRMVKRLCNQILDSGDKEVSTTKIGELVMEELRKTDDVAYVRFASVYRQFKDINEFMRELKGLKARQDGIEKTSS